MPAASHSLLQEALNGKAQFVTYPEIGDAKFKCV